MDINKQNGATKDNQELHHAIKGAELLREAAYNLAAAELPRSAEAARQLCVDICYGINLFKKNTPPLINLPAGAQGGVGVPARPSAGVVIYSDDPSKKIATASGGDANGGEGAA